MLIKPALCIFVCGLLSSTQALDNGLARTPPMGWLSWLRFGCTIDCNAKPKECISENLIKRTADLMVSEGYLAAGYQYITIDDCWLEKTRDAEGRLVADRERFPNGMKALSDYMFIPALFIFCGLVWSSQALDNGIALTPPMGWFSWLRYNCTIDCEKYPTECISENLIKRTADAMASEGYLEAGYQYVTIDDCWPEKKRGPDGRLVPDLGRFPSGMLALSRYVQSKGLKFGIYENYGPLTCAGYPGVLGHEATDVATFIEWEVDYVKLDGCGAPDPDEGYPMFGKLLNETGRPIVYSCSWPAYQSNPNYTSIAKACNIWWNYGDIQNNWSSLVNIMAWFGEKQDDFAHMAGPGNFNDPDMLIIGNSGLTVDQAQVQMAVWSVLAAPLIMSAEVSSIQPEFKEILLNKDVIAVNQDALGKQGRRIWTGVDNDPIIWHRELSDGARALAFVNLRDVAANVSYTHEQMKLPLQDYILQDLYKKEEERTLRAGEDLNVKINSTGVKFYKFIPKNSREECEEHEERTSNENEVLINNLL